jgi:hypothetical protein
MLTSRFRRRLLHHISIGSIGLGLTLVFMHLFAKRDFIWRLSIGTAYAGLFLTATAVLVGLSTFFAESPIRSVLTCGATPAYGPASWR